MYNRDLEILEYPDSSILGGRDNYMEKMKDRWGEGFGSNYDDMVRIDNGAWAYQTTIDNAERTKTIYYKYCIDEDCRRAEYFEVTTDLLDED